MKNLNFTFKSIVRNKARWLLTLIAILILSVGQTKAWYVKGSFDGWNVQNMGSGNEYTYWNISPGTYYYQFSSSSNSNWSGTDCVQNKRTWDHHKSLQESDFGLTSGQMTIKIPENSNITIQYVGDGTNYNIDVFVRPAYYFKYDWYDGTWAWCGWLVRCGDGTYATEGKYRNSCTSFNYATKDMGSATGDGSSSTINKDGTLTDGLKCFFIYNPSSSPKSLTIQEKNSTAGTNYIFFDNTNAGLSDTYKYFVLGHLSYSRVCSLSKVGSSDYTNLYVATRSGNDWTGDGCFAYFGVIGSNSTFSDGAWASDNMYRASHYSAPLYKHLNLANGYNYLISKADNTNGNPITVEQKGNAYGSLNFTQTIKYQLSKNGSAYADMSASDGETPATITASSYKFNDRTTVTGSSLDNALAVNTTTRFSSTITAAYTGKTTLTVSNVRPGYKFIGWYEGNTQKSTNTSYTYRPTGETIVTARFKKLYGFIEGRFAIRNAARNSLIYTNSSGEWVTNVTTIPMEYDEANHRFYVHTYSEPNELKEQIGSQDSYFIVKTSSSSTTINGDGKEYFAAADTDAGKKLTAAGNASGKAIGNTSGSFTFLGNTTQNAYAVIYCDGEKVWYEVEYMLEYDANESNSGSIPAGRTYHMAGTTPTTATNSNNLSKNGYDFNGWSTSSGVGQTPTYSVGATMSSMSANVKLYAAWTAHVYDITLDKGLHGAAAGSGTVVFDATSATISTGVSANAGYNLVGYYNGETKVLNMDGSFANTTVTGYITSGKWSKYDADPLTLTAKFVPVTLTFNSGTDWDDVANWSPACVPTIEHDVIIPRTCRVTNSDAQAKSVKIHNYGDGVTEGRLYVENGGGLIVDEGITAKHAADGPYEATTDMDLWIRTDASNNSGLICGDASENTKATYIFYSKVYRFGSYYINQYVGIPFTTMSPYQWYGVYVFEYDAAKDAWKNPSDGDLAPFTAYNIISKSSGVTSTTFYTDGTLNLPGTSGTQELNCGSRYSTSETFNDKDHNGDYLFANSWTAPISVAAMNSDDVDSVLQEVHIFNAGFVSEDDSIKEIGENAGQWTAISFGAASYLTHAVIPATQAFCVTATKANAKLTLDYGKHVYNPAIAGGINNDPTRAPRRSSGMNEDPNILRIMVRSDSVMADNMYVFEREDYTYGYDNGWDGTKMMGESFAPQIYGIQGEGKTSIHAIPNMNGTEIGFKAGTQANAYELYFDYNNDEPLYLYDKDTQVFTLIDNETAYSFITSDTEEHARFVLTRSNAPAVATAIENGKSVIRAEKFIEDGQLFILRGDKIYNATGVFVK